MLERWARFERVRRRQRRSVGDSKGDLEGGGGSVRWCCRGVIGRDGGDEF